jgi:hypothetical protein
MFFLNLISSLKSQRKQKAIFNVKQTTTYPSPLKRLSREMDLAFDDMHGLF